MDGKKAFLGRRRDRSIATILSFKERECDNYLPPATRAKLRSLLLDEINDLCETAFDLMGGDDVVMNDLFLERLDMIAEKVSALTED